MNADEMTQASSAAEALELKIRNSPRLPGCIGIQTVVLKRGPRAYKTASLLTFGSAGNITKRELRVQTWNLARGTGYDFVESRNAWHCEDAEVTDLAAFVAGELSEAGMYRRIDGDSPVAALVTGIEKGAVDAKQMTDLVAAMSSVPGAAEVLECSPAAEVLLNGVQVIRQRRVVENLATLVVDPATPESAIQRVLSGNWWMFGGRFIDKSKRRNLTVLDQMDIPLIRSDGALHIVELKLAHVPQLVVPYRSHFVVGQAVNEAVGQAQNYLRELDEQRDTIKVKLGIECSRAFATVVIGHPRFVGDHAPAEEIAKTLRTYNSHLSRVEAITYADLLNGARQALTLVP